MWERALENLRTVVTRPSFETWLRDTDCVGIESNRMYISAPNNFVAEMLDSRMYSLISSELNNVLGYEMDIEFVVLIP